MRFRPEVEPDSTALRGLKGELVLVRAHVESRLLEELLEALSGADFPINPEIRHGFPDTIVEFPAYDTQIADIRALLQLAGLRPVNLELAAMLRAIA